MSEMACVRGCAMLRRHLVECEGNCRGCLPRKAEHGRLCWPCHRRLQLMLHDAPTVHDWLTANLPAGEGAAPMGDYIRGNKADGSPAPLKVAIFDARQQLADQLVSWVDLLCEERTLTGPKRHSVLADAKFLMTWLGEIEKGEWVADFWDELADTMIDAHALAPWRPEVRRQQGIPCPDCEEHALVIFGGEEDVSCVRCRTMMTPQQYNLWRRILQDEAEKVSA